MYEVIDTSSPIPPSITTRQSEPRHQVDEKDVNRRCGREMGPGVLARCLTVTILGEAWSWARGSGEQQQHLQTGNTDSHSLIILYTNAEMHLLKHSGNNPVWESTTRLHIYYLWLASSLEFIIHKINSMQIIIRRLTIKTLPMSLQDLVTSYWLHCFKRTEFNPNKHIGSEKWQ